ncbi:hypothetical protein N657DRAFT_577352 [Parathielavia appendiculata]|uniref:Ecp2 effector protein-like domain-containing protein n=1 Tax=Parathielavia appendiculata TaxID=2587402 RepID=A0AAN6TVI4_9PEZI|nr:hypothetical protein N657DRAFT_577352 [Parathielavia appendiculata]
MTLASGAPTEPSSPVPESGILFTPAPKTSNLFAARAINDCGDSTFENQSSGGSPRVADCWRLHDNIAGDGTWTVWGPNHRTLATYGTCAFGVTCDSAGPTEIGNGDIRDLVRDSINRFGGAGVVGAKGRMKCESPFGVWVDVEWGLYHT